MTFTMSVLDSGVVDEPGQGPALLTMALGPRGDRACGAVGHGRQPVPSRCDLAGAKTPRAPVDFFKPYGTPP